MKKILVSLLIFLSVAAAYAQPPGSMPVGMIWSVVEDSTEVFVPAGHGALYYNQQSSKWRWTNDGIIWYDFSSGTGGGSSTYGGTSPTTVTVGGLTSGSSIAGNSYDNIIQSIVAPYVNPVFTTAAIGVTSTQEVGYSFTTPQTFTWSITLNSGTVSTVDVYDITGSTTRIAATPNDGTQSVTINTNQLNSNGATQQWRVIGNDTGGGPVTFNSSTITVTSRYYRFFGAAATPVNSAQVRALPLSAFHTGASTFTMATGTSATNFAVALPPGVTILTVIDVTNLGADITSEFILQGSTVNVLDAGGNNQAYNIYEYSIGAPYPVTATLSITTNN